MATKPTSQSTRTPAPWQGFALTPRPANAADPRHTNRPAAVAVRPPHRHKPLIIVNWLEPLPSRHQADAGQNRRIDNLFSIMNRAERGREGLGENGPSAERDSGISAADRVAFGSRAGRRRG